MDFDLLPNEILEKITLYLDGETLFRAKQTCKRWRSVVEYAETSLNVWKRLCIHEISTDLLAELNGFKERNDDEKGDSLLTGHTDGTVILWNSQTGNFIGVVAQHMKPVTVLIFIDYYAHELNSSNHFLTASMDRTLKCFSSLFYNDHQVIHFNTFIKTVRMFDKKVAVQCNDGCIFMLEMKLEDELRLEKLFEVPSIGRMVSRCNWMGFWKDTLTCITLAMDCYTSKINEYLWSVHPPSLVEDNDSVASDDIVAADIYLFRRNIVILITVNRYFLISVDGHHYRQYSSLKDLKGIVTSVTISGNLLALGTDTGRLYVYHFKNDSDLMDLHLDDPSWFEEMSTREEIVSIDIKLDSSEPVIVAANPNGVFLVRFVAPAAKKSKEIGLELSRKYWDFITCK